MNNIDPKILLHMEKNDKGKLKVAANLDTTIHSEDDVKNLLSSMEKATGQKVDNFRYLPLLNVLTLQANVLVIKELLNNPAVTSATLIDESYV